MATFALLVAGCTEEEGSIDADLFFDVCYNADLSQQSADRCMDPQSVSYAEYGSAPRCSESSAELPILRFEYAIATFGANEVKVYSDQSLLGTGVITGKHVEYQSPTYREERETGTIEWNITGWLEWYDGQAGDNPCPGLNQVSQPDSSRSSYCVGGGETLWVLSSTDPDIPANSDRSSCNQRFLFGGERVSE